MYFSLIAKNLCDFCNYYYMLFYFIIKKDLFFLYMAICSMKAKTIFPNEISSKMQCFYIMIKLLYKKGLNLCRKAYILTHYRYFSDEEELEGDCSL